MVDCMGIIHITQIVYSGAHKTGAFLYAFQNRHKNINYLRNFNRAYKLTHFESFYDFRFHDLLFRDLPLYGDQFDVHVQHAHNPLILPSMFEVIIYGNTMRSNFVFFV